MKLQTTSDYSMKSFSLIWSGQAISLFGSAIVQFALIWWLTQKTGSATILAMASLVGLLPPVLLGPFAGVLVDRMSRRLTLILADGLVALATIVLAYLFWLDVIAVWHVFVLLFVRALGGAFHYPAFQASTALMVPEKHLTRIQGMNQILEGSLSVVSAPLGAVLLGVLPMQGVLAIDVITAVFAILPLLFLAIPQPKRQAETSAETATFRTDLREGFRYVWAWPGLMIMMLLAMLVNLMLTPSTSLQPLLITEHFGGGALQLSFLEASFGIGIIVGGVGLSVWGGFKRRIVTTIVGLIGLGVSFLFIGLAPANAFWMAVTGAFFAGGMIALTNGPVRAILQSVIAPEMQGRVMSLIISLSSAMSPIGLIIAGPAADLLGIRTWYVFAGVVASVVGIVGFFLPPLMNVENGRLSSSVPLQVESEFLGVDSAST